MFSALLLLAAVPVVPAGEIFTCTPVSVWDGDGPVWCAEGPALPAFRPATPFGTVPQGRVLADRLLRRADIGGRHEFGIGAQDRVDRKTKDVIDDTRRA